MEAQSQAGRRPAALVVDADASVRELIRYVLEKGGFQVRAVADGEAAVSELEASRPDLLVTNLRLRNMSGDELIGYVRADTTLAGIPILVVSGYLDSLELSAPADAAVQKPFSPRELLDRALELTARRPNRRSGS